MIIPRIFGNLITFQHEAFVRNAYFFATFHAGMFTPKVKCVKYQACDNRSFDKRWSLSNEWFTQTCSRMTDWLNRRFIIIFFIFAYKMTTRIIHRRWTAVEFVDTCNDDNSGWITLWKLNHQITIQVFIYAMRYFLNLASIQ